MVVMTVRPGGEMKPWLGLVDVIPVGVAGRRAPVPYDGGGIAVPALLKMRGRRYNLAPILPNLKVDS